jgi:hypothetical protein
MFKQGKSTAVKMAGALAAAAALVMMVPTANADQIYDWTWTGSSSGSASGTIDVDTSGTNAVSGTGTLTISGGATYTLTLLTGASPGVNQISPGPPPLYHVRTGDGTDLNGFDTFVNPTTSPYVDDAGLTFMFGPVSPSNQNPYAINFADNGIGWFGKGDPATGTLYDGNLGGTFTIGSAVPLPSPLILLGSALLGVLVISRRRSGNGTVSANLGGVAA